MEPVVDRVPDVDRRGVGGTQAGEPPALGGPAGPHPSAAAPCRQPGRLSWRRGAAIAVAVLAVAGAARWLFHQFTHVSETDARIAADMVVISSRLPGWVAAVEAAEGDAVRKGQALARIDDRENRMQAREIEAQLAGVPARREEIGARITLADRQTRGEVAAQEAAVKAAEAALAAAQAQSVLAVAENDRVVDLVRQGMVTRLRQDQTLAAVETARQQAASAEANVQRALRWRRPGRGARTSPCCSVSWPRSRPRKNGCARSTHARSSSSMTASSRCPSTASWTACSSTGANTSPPASA